METDDLDTTATVPESLPVVQPVPPPMSAITELKGLELTLSLRILWVQISKQRSKDDSQLHRVSNDQGVELTFDVSWNDLEKFKQNRIPHVISSLQRFAEVRK